MTEVAYAWLHRQVSSEGAEYDGEDDDIEDEEW